MMMHQFFHIENDKNLLNIPLTFSINHFINFDIENIKLQKRKSIYCRKGNINLKPVILFFLNKIKMGHI